MILKELLKDIETVEVLGDVLCEVNNIKTDSNSITKGSLFVCLNGTDYDGHNFVSQAEKYGCSAIVTEKKVISTLPQIVVKNTRTALGLLASAFYGYPNRGLRIIGVLGTNGKTTTAKLICDIINESGLKCGFIGTPGTYYNGRFFEQNLTTPDPVELFKIFYDMRASGVEAVVMEVSAHAIFYDKICGINFEGAVFTNLTQDHLDFFQTMEEYKQAKLKFFRDYKTKFIVTNSDDEVGREIAKMYPSSITYGIDNPADVFAIDLSTSTNGQQFVMNLFDCIYDMKINLLGKFNAYNALAASTASALFGIKTRMIKVALEGAKPVEGRLERVAEAKFTVVVDYAHTPDGLEKALTTLRPLCRGRLICLFGCGGNRDASKRAIMGRVSGKYADFTVLTSDNPRFEEPLDIILDIEKGLLKETKDYIIVQDREEAIKYAMDYALAEDLILIAGKGGEKYQEMLGIKHPYNDKDTVMKILRSKD